MKTNEKTIYLLRHAEPLHAGNSRRCVGLTDVPITDYGRREAGKLKTWFRDKGIRRIYTSPLKRCRQTAEMIADGQMEVIPMEGLHEMEVGQWENMTFREIREKYPKEYEERGKNLGYYAPPGGESFQQAGLRFSESLKPVLDGAEDAIVVAHGGVNRGFVCLQQGISFNQVMNIPQPYAGINVIKESEEGIHFEKIGYKPSAFLDREEMGRLFQKYQTSEPVKRHMEAVADFLGRMVDHLEKSGETDWRSGWDAASAKDILIQSALVHDLVRDRKCHAIEGAKVLRSAGYEEIADLVEVHHGLPDREWEILSPKSLLFYADKRVMEDSVVSLDERFQASRVKCKCREAFDKHERLYMQSVEIEKRLRLSGFKQ
ncbi:MAG: histidine phosphatase family protein [Lachnospiraceae bacterium]|nr:histidine phosphatase family protein [Lachnospiraceae bacterium]